MKICVIKYLCIILQRKIKRLSIIMRTISEKRAEKIARNINAMDINYQYGENMKSIRFWSSLYNKLRVILATLSDADKKYISTLCNQTVAQFFNLI